MKKTIITISILFQLFATPVLAFNAQSTETDLFPIQPILIYQDASFIINQFKMPSISIGRGWSSYPHGIKNLGRFLRNQQEFKIKLEELESLKSKLLKFVCNSEVKLEVPYYRDRVSLGLDYQGSLKLPPGDIDIVSQRGLFALYRSLDETEYDKEFAAIWTHELLGTVKGKLPFNTKFGHFALTLTSKAGFIHVKGYLSRHRDKHSGVHKPGRLPHNVGWVAALSTGVDYYFNQWVGLYVEGSLKYNNICWFLKRHDSGTELPKSYDYVTTSISVGLKTTF